MKKVILSLFLLLSVSIFALKEVNGVLYRGYGNSRFGFYLEYPAEILFMQPAPANNDGRRFVSNDGETEMLAYGAYSLDFYPSELSPIQQLRNHYYDSLGNEYAYADITYKKLNEAKGWYIISGTQNGKIFYKKIHLAYTPDSYFMIFNMEYPIYQKQLYNKILENITRTISY
ncbi:MAG: hypothetical protein ACRCYT_04065 [Cetobacterium sp.]